MAQPPLPPHESRPPDSGLAIERMIPELAGKLPRARCTHLPTPVHRLDRLGPAFGISELWIKRDDQSGALYGGNKPRKLDFILGDALARGKRSVMTFGGIGTNHGLATAIYARELGLHAFLLLLRQPVTEKVRRGLLLYHAYGAEMHYAATVSRLVAQALVLCAREMLRGGIPYIIPTGGSSPIGVLGYVNAAFELKEQTDAGLLPAPDWIFVPVGTAGTLAGLILGCKLAGLSTRVAGVLVTDILPPTPRRVARLGNRACGIVCRAAPSLPVATLSPDDVLIVREFLGETYGMPTPAARAARDAIERLEGIAAETTYTAKCLAAVHALAGTPPYRDSVILYWHTYSSVDAARVVTPLPDHRALPREFHQFFVGEPVAD